MPRLKEKYNEEIVPAMLKDFGYDNVMQVPKVSKIVVNVGLGEALQNAKALEKTSQQVSTIEKERNSPFPSVNRPKEMSACCVP